jgi:hypothetical protein
MFEGFMKNVKSAFEATKQIPTTSGHLSFQFRGIFGIPFNRK